MENYEFNLLMDTFDDNEVYVLGDVKLYLINDKLITAENIDKKLKADLIVFLSKHKSKENTPAMTVHSIGNWDKAEHGGSDKYICPTSPEFIKEFFIELNKNDLEDYEFTMESTHHGPKTSVPAVFIEIGSTEKEWTERENGKIMANTLMKVVKNKKYKTAIGIGGTHYCNNFNKINLRTDIAVGIVCPKHSLNSLNEEFLKNIKVDLAILDWKGLGQEKERIISLLEEVGLGWKRSDKILKS